MMNEKALKNGVKVLLLLGLAGFLISRLLNGTLNFYIHPRFNGLTLATAVILTLVAFIYWWRSARQDEASCDHHDHDHDIPWLGLLILSMPVLLGLFVQPTPLGANALDNREINFSLTAVQSDSFETAPLGGPRNILDWLYDFQRQGEPSLFNGQEADVVGFVFRDERFGEEQFMVSRFTINCCVADANPVGLIVQADDAALLAENSWVQVNGRFQAQQFDGKMIPVLIADQITPVDAPQQPYLYE